MGMDETEAWERGQCFLGEGVYVHQPHSNFQHVILEGEIRETGPGAGGAVGGFLGGGEEVGAGFVEGGHGYWVLEVEEIYLRLIKG